MRILVLCTGNSARSQMAEALLNVRGAGRIVAESAGSRPAAQVHPLAIERLAAARVDWTVRRPRGIGEVEDQAWDLVLTVCDHARDACPVLPGAPFTAHWGQDDPAAVEGPAEVRRAAFQRALALLEWRVGQLLALPLDPADLRSILPQVQLMGRMMPESPTPAV